MTNSFYTLCTKLALLNFHLVPVCLLIMNDDGVDSHNDNQDIIIMIMIMNNDNYDYYH